MYADYNGNNFNWSLLWVGDLNQDGVVNIFDLTEIFNLLNDPIAPMGYQIEDIDGDGIVNIYDLAIVFDNVNYGASSINPFTAKKKK